MKGGKIDVQVCTLISGRTLEQAKGMHGGKNNDGYKKAVEKAFLSPLLLEKLGLSEGEEILLTTPYGSVRVKTCSDMGLPEDVVFMPMGPMVNLLVGPETEGTGMPSFKGLKVEVNKAR